MKIDKNDPAFPFAAEWGYKSGLPIRAELAARAMQGIIAGHFTNQDVYTSMSSEDVAIEAVQYADALIAELNKEQSH